MVERVLHCLAGKWEEFQKERDLNDKVLRALGIPESWRGDSRPQGAAGIEPTGSRQVGPDAAPGSGDARGEAQPS